MITDFLNFLGGAVFDFINGILGIFPSMSIHANSFLTATGNVATVLSWVNWFLPLDVAGSIIALWAVAMMSYLGLKMAMKYSGELT